MSPRETHALMCDSSRVVVGFPTEAEAAAEARVGGGGKDDDEDLDIEAEDYEDDW